MARALVAYQSKVPKAYPAAVHESELAAAMEAYHRDASSPAAPTYAKKLQQVIPETALNLTSLTCLSLHAQWLPYQNSRPLAT